MFKGLRDEILRLNRDVGDVANCEKAKKLRKTLLKIGIPLATVGGIGLFACFAAFVISGFSSVGSATMPGLGILIPFLLIIPMGLLLSAGVFLIQLALSIIIAGAVSTTVDEVVGNNCPNCKKPIEENATFCSFCGTTLVKVCRACETENSYKDKFCKKCGKEL